MTNISLSLTLGIVLCISGCATAASTHAVASAAATSNDAAFKLLDTNGDGYLSRNELEQQHAVGLLRDMRRADANGDGKVSLAEWRVWWPTTDRSAPAGSLAALNRSSAPLNGISSDGY